MKYVKIILPGPAVTLGLGVESHQDLQLEDVTVILSPLPILLLRQELVPSKSPLWLWFLPHLPAVLLTGGLLDSDRGHQGFFAVVVKIDPNEARTIVDSGVWVHIDGKLNSGYLEPGRDNLLLVRFLIFNFLEKVVNLDGFLGGFGDKRSPENKKLLISDRNLLLGHFL